MAGKHRGGGLRELFRRRPGPGPRTPHGLYVRNDAGFKHLTDNIVFDNLGNGFHCYASSKVAVRNPWWKATLYSITAASRTHRRHPTTSSSPEAAGPVESYPGLAVAAVTMQTLGTEAMLLSAAVGLAVLAKRRNPAALLALSTSCSRRVTFRWECRSGFGCRCRGWPPALAGFSSLWHARSSQTIVRSGLLACLVAPYGAAKRRAGRPGRRLVGMQTLSGDSAYRSGLEIRPCNRPFRSRPFLQPALAAGPLVPTSEGPRPVGGHAFVLVGVWGRIVQAGADQLDGSAQAAARGLPILQDFGRGLVVSTLAGMGFRTDDPRNSKARTFVSADGRPACRFSGSETARTRSLPPARRDSRIWPAVAAWWLSRTAPRCAASTGAHPMRWNRSTPP